MQTKPEPSIGLTIRLIKPRQRARDELDQLRCDHERIRKLLHTHERLRRSGAASPEGKADIVERLCDALSLCALIEEEVFYPLVRPVLGTSLLAQNALCDHARLRSLIAHLDELEPHDPGYDDAVAAIGDCVLPAMNFARTALFETVRLAGLDTAALGEQMTRRRKLQQPQGFTRAGLSLPSTTAAPEDWPPACHWNLVL